MTNLNHIAAVLRKYADEKIGQGDDECVVCGEEFGWNYDAPEICGTCLLSAAEAIEAAARLPRTADGKMVLPDDKVFYPGESFTLSVVCDYGDLEGWQVSDGIKALQASDCEWPYAVARHAYYEEDTGHGESLVALVSECYSSAEAAAAALASVGKAE